MSKPGHRTTQAEVQSTMGKERQAANGQEAVRQESSSEVGVQNRSAGEAAKCKARQTLKQGTPSMHGNHHTQAGRGPGPHSTQSTRKQAKP